MRYLSQVKNTSYDNLGVFKQCIILWGGIAMSEYSIVLTIGSFLILSYYIVYTIAKS
jgi:hypothetical protein